ncbi:MAG: ABC transporter permease subunit [Cyanobacteria bacterium P01_D01_bin.2]
MVSIHLNRPYENSLTRFLRFLSSYNESALVPDLIWGLIFIIVVGLGPAAGILALTADTMGFYGKFFAERIEEIEPGPVEAVKAIGASDASIIIGAIFPATLPSFVASTLFALEASVRSAVVLGLVGLAALVWNFPRPCSYFVTMKPSWSSL